jgi:hypothetical protein
MITSNVIVLTSGENGSSVMTGLLARAGLWTGETFKKREYDTFENSELVRLDIELLARAGYKSHYNMVEFSQEAIDLIASLDCLTQDSQYRNFIRCCEAHRPWIWKDPRLWLTIRAWAPLLDLDSCKFILLTCDLRRAWVATTLRRQIRSYPAFKRYEQAIQDSMTEFLTSRGLGWLPMTYESLIAQPEVAISRLNEYVGTDLTVEDLRKLYRGALYKIPRSSPINFVKAVMIYLKNMHAGPTAGSDRVR